MAPIQKIDATSQEGVPFNLDSFVDFPPLRVNGDEADANSFTSVVSVPPLVERPSLHDSDDDDDDYLDSSVQESSIAHSVSGTADLTKLPKLILVDEPSIVPSQNFHLYDTYIEWSRVDRYMASYFSSSWSTPLEVTEMQIRGSPHVHWIGPANNTTTTTTTTTTMTVTTNVENYANNGNEEEMERVD